MSRADLALEALRRVERHGDENDWLGPDPYEGLNSTRFTGPLQRSPMGRRILIQVVKRSPLNLRPVLGIRPTPNSATAAWALSAYASGGFLEPGDEVAKIERGVERLLALRSPQFRENAWGYQFPTQSRVFFYDRYAPSTVATVWAAHALLDSAQRLGSQELVAEAESAVRFLLDQVPQTEDAPGAFFGYLVGDRSPIHNSNLHACALVARVGALTGDERLLETAASGVEWSLARQRPDGSWPYGEHPNLRWVDGFHTGYVLDALGQCRDANVPCDIDDAWARGLAYYREQMFLADGTPKYYASETFPIDSSCVAQAIQTFALASERVEDALEHAWKVLDWALAHMRRRDGLFIFQRRRFWSNRTPHMRWSQAAMLLAMAHLWRAESRVQTAAAPAVHRPA